MVTGSANRAVPCRGIGLSGEFVDSAKRAVPCRGSGASAAGSESAKRAVAVVLCRGSLGSGETASGAASSGPPTLLSRLMLELLTLDWAVKCECFSHKEQERLIDHKEQEVDKLEADFESFAVRSGTDTKRETTGFSKALSGPSWK